MDTTIANIIGLALSTGSVILVGLLVAVIAQKRKEIPNIIATLPKDIKKIIEDAAKFASEYVELMDKNGQLTQYLNELKAKGQVKLDLAVDYAVEYIENLFIKNGLNVDIDQESIKKAIQKYVWENPEIFPSSKKVDDGRTDS